MFYSAFRKTASFSLSRRGVSVFLAALYLLFQSVKGAEIRFRVLTTLRDVDAQAEADA